MRPDWTPLPHFWTYGISYTNLDYFAIIYNTVSPIVLCYAASKSNRRTNLINLDFFFNVDHFLGEPEKNSLLLSALRAWPLREKTVFWSFKKSGKMWPLSSREGYRDTKKIAFFCGFPYSLDFISLVSRLYLSLSSAFKIFLNTFWSSDIFILIRG